MSHRLPHRYPRPHNHRANTKYIGVVSSVPIIFHQFNTKSKMYLTLSVLSAICALSATSAAAEAITSTNGNLCYASCSTDESGIEVCTFTTKVNLNLRSVEMTSILLLVWNLVKLTNSSNRTEAISEYNELDVMNIICVPYQH